jgi:hypothetical protein
MQKISLRLRERVFTHDLINVDAHRSLGVFEMICHQKKKKSPQARTFYMYLDDKYMSCPKKKTFK